jgi:hypothetical protein
MGLIPTAPERTYQYTTYTVSDYDEHIYIERPATHTCTATNCHTQPHTLPHTAARTATHCRTAANKLPHCHTRTAALPHTAAHYRTQPHYLTAAHCHAHCVHNQEHCRAYCPHTCAHSNKLPLAPLALPHCRTNSFDSSKFILNSYKFI